MNNDRRMAYTCYLDKKQIIDLNKLREKTKVPVANFIREGIDIVLKKHGKACKQN